MKRTPGPCASSCGTKRIPAVSSARCKRSKVSTATRRLSPLPSTRFTVATPTFARRARSVWLIPSGGADHFSALMPSPSRLSIRLTRDCMDLIPFEGGCVLIAGAFVPFFLVAISRGPPNGPSKSCAADLRRACGHFAGDREVLLRFANASTSGALAIGLASSEFRLLPRNSAVGVSWPLSLLEIYLRRKEGSEDACVQADKYSS